MNTCDVKAECRYDDQLQNYRCQCMAGFEGDGYECRSRVSCRENRTICHPDSECVFLDRQEYGCQCRIGFIGDGYECQPVPVHEGDYLLFAHGMSVLRMPLMDIIEIDREPSSPAAGYPLFTKSEQTIVALEVDCFEGYIYWSDVSKGHIHKATANGTSTEPLLEGYTNAPEGLAVDWVSRNIYWTDSFKKSIEVSNLDGSLHKVLINKQLVNPRGIAVHPGK